MDIAIVADDLTGAADTAVMFAGGGRSVAVALTLDAATTADVVAVDTASRDRSPAVGAYRVFKAVSALAGVAAPLWYKKLDSTLRGNVASELDAFRRACQCGPLVLAPAYPAQERTTLDGVQHFDDAAMGGAQRHDIAALLASLGRPLLTVGLSDVRQGAAALAARFRAASRGALLVCDALTDGDLDRVAAAALAGGAGHVALAGSAGLAAAVRRCRYHEGPAGVAPLPGPRPVLLVVGTRNPVARRQLAVAAEALRLAPCAAMRAALPRFGLAGEGALAPCDDGCRVLASAAERLPGDPRDIVRDLARQAAVLVRRHEMRRLFVTGGEAARALLDELGVTRLAVRGAVAEGMPALSALDGVPGLAVVTKAGGFGDDDAIARAARYLRGAAG